MLAMLLIRPVLCLGGIAMLFLWVADTHEGLAGLIWLANRCAALGVALVYVAHRLPRELWTLAAALWKNGLRQYRTCRNLLDREGLRVASTPVIRPSETEFHSA